MSTEAISETVSENSTKRGRGRPVGYCDAETGKPFDDDFLMLFVPGDTMRHKQNVLQAGLAHRVLKEQGRSAAIKQLNKVVLIELGRLIWQYSDGRDWAIKFADALCETDHGLNAKETASLVRDWRLGKIAGDPVELLQYRVNVKRRDKQDAGTKDGLTEDLIEYIDAYRLKHPDMTFADVEDAVQDVLSWYYMIQNDPENGSVQPVLTDCI